MDIGQITKNIANYTTPIIFPTDRLGKVANIFFGVSFVYCAYHKFFASVSDKLTIPEKIECRALIEESKTSKTLQIALDVKRKLQGKDELDLWTRLILHMGMKNFQSNDHNITDTSAEIKSAPERLQIELYKQLARLIAIVEPKNLNSILTKLVDLEISSFETSQQTRPFNQKVEILLSLAKEYRDFNASHLFEEMKPYVNKWIQAKENPRASTKDLSSDLIKLKEIVTEECNKKKSLLEQIFLIHGFLEPLNELARNEFSNSVYQLKEEITKIEKLLRKLDQNDLLDSCSAQDWTDLHCEMIFSIENAYYSDNLIAETIATVSTYNPSTPQGLKEKFAAYLKILHFLSINKNSMAKEDLLCKQIDPLLQQIWKSDQQGIPLLEKFALYAELLPYYSDDLDKQKIILKDACNHSAELEQEFTKAQDKEKALIQLEKLNIFIEEIVKFKDLNKNESVNEVAFINVLYAIHSTFSSKNAEGWTGQVKQLCLLLNLEEEHKKSQKESIHFLLNEKLFQLMSTFFDRKKKIEMLLMGFAAFRNKKSFDSNDAKEILKNAFTIAKELPDNSIDLESRLLSEFKSKFTILRDLYVEFGELNEEFSAKACFQAMEQVQENTIEDKIYHDCEIAKLHWIDLPVGISTERNQGRLYPRPFAIVYKIAQVSIQSAVELTEDPDFNSLPIDKKVSLLHYLMIASCKIDSKIFSTLRDKLSSLISSHIDKQVSVAGLEANFLLVERYYTILEDLNASISHDTATKAVAVVDSSNLPIMDKAKLKVSFFESLLKNERGELLDALLSSEMEKLKLFEEKDKLESLILFMPLSISLGTYGKFHHQFFNSIQKNWETISVKSAECLQTVALKLKEKNHFYSYYSSLKEYLFQSQSDRMDYLNNPSQKAEISILFEEIGEATVYITVIPSGLKKKNLIETFLNQAYKLGSEVNLEWIKTNLLPCEAMLGRKKTLVQTTAFLAIFGFAKILLSSEKRYLKGFGLIGWTILWSGANRLIGKFYKE